MDPISSAIYALVPPENGGERLVKYVHKTAQRLSEDDLIGKVVNPMLKRIGPLIKGRYCFLHGQDAELEFVLDMGNDPVQEVSELRGNELSEAMIRLGEPLQRRVVHSLNWECIGLACDADTVVRAAAIALKIQTPHTTLANLFKAAPIKELTELVLYRAPYSPIPTQFLQALIDSGRFSHVVQEIFSGNWSGIDDCFIELLLSLSPEDRVKMLVFETPAFLHSHGKKANILLTYLVSELSTVFCLNHTAKMRTNAAQHLLKLSNITLVELIELTGFALLATKKPLNRIICGEQTLHFSIDHQRWGLWLSKHLGDDLDKLVWEFPIELALGRESFPYLKLATSQDGVLMYAIGSDKMCYMSADEGRTLGVIPCLEGGPIQEGDRLFFSKMGALYLWRCTSRTLTHWALEEGKNFVLKSFQMNVNAPFGFDGETLILASDYEFTHTPEIGDGLSSPTTAARVQTMP